MSPVGVAFNVLAQANEQPGYQTLWEPFAVDPASAAVITVPTSSAKAAGWVPGALMAFNTAGVGTNPGPGGDGSQTLSTPYTVQYVDPAPTTSTIYLAGVLLGVGTPGAAAPFVPNAPPSGGVGPQLIAMVAKRGLVQVYSDNTTTIGHTLLCSTSNIGCASDSGGTTRTYGTEFGIALQAVTVSGAPALVWASVNFP